jgi:hypothetical protein
MIMPTTFQNISLISKSFSYFGGILVIFLAVSLYFFGITPGESLGWVVKILGWSFSLLLISLIMTCVFCILKIRECSGIGNLQLVNYWQQIGLQSSSGIATLALTYTLFGISMGISTLSTQELSEHNVNGIISQLTQQFGLAFMTSVIGLPISAALRSLTIVMPLSNLSAKTQIEAQDANL